MSILDTLQQRHAEKKKSIAVLVDPDKAEDPAKLLHLINLANERGGRDNTTVVVVDKE